MTEQNINLPFDKQVSKIPMAVNRDYFVKIKNAVLREGASASAAEFGRVEKGAALHGVGELDDWIHVEIAVEKAGNVQKERFWVERNALTTKSPAPGAAGVASAKVIVTRFDAPSSNHYICAAGNIIC